MIEIIGSKSIDESRLPKRELPKNVRQIGETREKRKIYMEDYVVTYLGKLAKPNQAYARGAILFGNLYQTEEGPAVFISGAMEAQNLELDMDETIFNDEIWRELLRKGEKHFKGQKVMGWFLSRMGFSVEMNQKIINTHLKNFPGDHKILYMIDSLEKEDAIYICENQQMIRQKGYYIYYEKNSAMQEYMLLGKPIKKTQEEREEGNRNQTDSFRNRKVLEEYRKRHHQNRKTPKFNYRGMLSKAAGLLLIVAMCTYVYGRMVDKQWIDGTLGNYVVETMGTIRNSFGSAERVVEEVWNGEVAYETKEIEDNTGAEQNTKPAGDTEIAGEEDKLTAREDKENRSTDGAESATPTKGSLGGDSDSENTVEAFGQSKPLYYIVKKGDTLASISRKMYLTDKYMKQIAWANDLDNANEIYEGQKLLIPSIE